MTTPNAPRRGSEAVAYLKAQRDSNTTKWDGLCLSLARHARGIPALYPSALAAAHATPVTERVKYWPHLKMGHVVYFDDPDDNNPYAHIATVAGWNGPRTDPDNCILGSNDVRGPDGNLVGFVPLTWFKKHWGDSFLFGAGWLNGYNFRELDAGTAVVKPHAGPELDAAIASLEKAIRRHRAAGGRTTLVNALVKDLAELKETRTRFP